MKLEPCTINPIEVVLDIIPKELAQLTNSMVDGIRLALLVGGVICETPEDVVLCLQTLDKMGVVELTEEETTFKIRKLI